MRTHFLHLASFALLLSFICTSSIPSAWAMRAESPTETGLEEKLADALRTVARTLGLPVNPPTPATAGLEEGSAVPTWAWSAMPGEIPLDQRIDLLLQAKANTHGAFALGKAVAVAGHGKRSQIPKKFQDLSTYVEETLSSDLKLRVEYSSPFLAKGEAANLFEWAKNNVRFVLVDDDNSGFLAAQGVAGSNSHTAVVAYAGWYPYPHWEEGMSPQMVEAIRRGMRARQQNQPLEADELPGPPTVYLSKTQVQGFLNGGGGGRQVFAIKLAHEIKDILRQGRHEEELPEATALVNRFITQTMSMLQETRNKQEEAALQREKGRLFKLHVTADLSPVLSPQATSEQRQEVLQTVESFLQQAQRGGAIYGFNVFLFNQGKLMVVDFDHRRGRASPEAEVLAHQAIIAGLRKAAELGILMQVRGENILDQTSPRQRALLNFRKGENNLTLRESEPIMTAQGIGLGMGAFNRAIWYLLMGDIVHLQAIGGERGFRVVVANLNDIRSGKPKYRRYVFDTPGPHDDTVKEIIRKLDDGTLTEDDLKNEIAQNLHRLHQHIGAMDEYAVEAVYALPGSKFGRTDEPMIQVHLHENPVAEFREQSGAWATGSVQKVLSMPYLAPNAGQTRWVGMIPITWEEAQDPSLLENQGWPLEELGFVTAWAWTYNDGGVDRGEPPQGDVFGKNDQTQITRADFLDFIQQWSVIGDFEPRLTAEEASRRAHRAAEAFPAVGTTAFLGREGETLPLAQEPPLARWAPIPNLKKERDPLVDRFFGPGHLVLSFGKADIGGKSGHDRVSLVQMAAVRAKLEVAKQNGLIRDYAVFFVGDDIQIAILHDRGVHDKAIHDLLWQAFNFSYWVSLKLGIGLYGRGQDIRASKFWAQHPAEKHANLARRDVEVLKGIFEQGINGQIEVPSQKFSEELQIASHWALGHFQRIQDGLDRWEQGVNQGTFTSETVEVGNVTGMGIGQIDYPVVDEEPMVLLGLDKSGGGGINARFKKALDLALEAVDLSPDDLVEMWDVEESRRRIVLEFGEHAQAIQDMLAKPNKFNIKRVGIVRNGKIVAWFSLEILAKVALGYVGKDDPIYGLAWPIARYLLATFSRAELAVIAQLGDEAGSHHFANVFRAWWESFPGERSNPVGVGIIFRVVDGKKIVMEDLGSKPEFAEGRRAAERFNQRFAQIQGEFSPLVASREQIESTYPRARLLANADEHPTEWADTPEAYTTAGLEEEAEVRNLSDILLNDQIPWNARERRGTRLALYAWFQRADQTAVTLRPQIMAALLGEISRWRRSANPRSPADSIIFRDFSSRLVKGTFFGHTQGVLLQFAQGNSQAVDQNEIRSTLSWMDEQMTRRTSWNDSPSHQKIRELLSMFSDDAAQRETLESAGLEELYLISRPDYEGPMAVLGKLGGTTMMFQAGIPDGLLEGTRVKADTFPPGRRGRDTQEQILDRIADQIGQVIDQHGANRVMYVYFSAPGFFNDDGTLAEDEKNIPGLGKGLSFEKEIGGRLARRYPRPAPLGPILVKVVHDATGGADGERSRFGTYPNEDDLFFVIAGTGIGTRRILNGRPFLGGPRVSNLHNEYPHNLIFNGKPENPDFESVILQTRGHLPNYGESLEKRTSGPNIALYAIRLAQSGLFESSDVEELEGLSPGHSLDQITTEILGKAANAPLFNPIAIKAIEERSRELGVGLAVLLAESNRNWEEFTWPRQIVIGSGVAQIGNLFLVSVKEGFRDRLTRYQKEDPFFSDLPVEELVNRVELSRIKDDSARELLGGLPSQEDLNGHDEKLKAAGLAAGLEERTGYVLVGGVAALMPKEVEHFYAVTVGLRQTEAVLRLKKVQPSRVVAVAVNSEEAESLQELGVPKVNIVEGWRFQSLAGAKRFAVEMAERFLKVVEGLQVSVLEATEQTVGRLLAQLEKLLPVSWQQSVTEEAADLVKSLNQLGV